MNGQLNDEEEGVGGLIFFGEVLLCGKCKLGGSNVEISFRKWMFMLVKILDVLLFYQKFGFLEVFGDDDLFEKQLLLLVVCFFLSVLGYKQLVVVEECYIFFKGLFDEIGVEVNKECFNVVFKFIFFDEIQIIFKKLFFDYFFDVIIVLVSKDNLDLVFVLGRKGGGKY